MNLLHEYQDKKRQLKEAIENNAPNKLELLREVGALKVKINGQDKPFKKGECN